MVDVVGLVGLVVLIRLIGMVGLAGLDIVFAVVVVESEPSLARRMSCSLEGGARS